MVSEKFTILHNFCEEIGFVSKSLTEKITKEDILTSSSTKYRNSEEIFPHLLLMKTTLTGEDKKSSAPVLRAAAVPLLDQNTCRSSEVNGGRNQKILDSMLCAGKFNFVRRKCSFVY